MNTVNSQQIVNAQLTVSASVPVRNQSTLLPDRQEPADNGKVVNGKAVPASSQEQELREKKDENLGEAIAKINNYVQQLQRDLQFSVDDDSGRTVIKVIDSNSKEVIRQIPEEVILQVAQSIEASLEGSLLEVEA